MSSLDLTSQPNGLPWDVDAASSPAEYWHWLRSNEQYVVEHADSQSRGDWPVDAPLLSVVVPVYRPLLWYFSQCVRRSSSNPMSGGSCASATMGRRIRT